MTTKLTKLTIGPRNSWQAESPVICTVQLNDDKSTVETVLSDADCQRILDLVRVVVAEAAKRNVEDFVHAARAIDAGAKAAAIPA